LTLLAQGVMKPVVFALFVVLAIPAYARREYRTRSYSRRYHSAKYSRARSHRYSRSRHARRYRVSSRPYSTFGRERRGRIRRSPEAKDAFTRENPCPSTGKRGGPCPGYVIDHINPLACGGADDPSNMQWQTVSEGKAKDEGERKGCSRK
jgi:5-methylcytosine-specific restriction endonuclease McrA